MGDIIELLPDHVANQIAAGEVIQRPASAVKELIENAVDAGATEVQLIIKDAGKSLIQVIDNGKGMSPTDLRMAFERHATSKIRLAERFISIEYQGFRGKRWLLLQQLRMWKPIAESKVLRWLLLYTLRERK